MSKVRVIYKADGTVGVIHPALNSKRPGESESEWLDRVFVKAVSGTPLEGLDFDDVELSELPQSREDRPYWKGEKGKKISIDTAKKNADKSKKDRKEKIDNEVKRMAEQSLIDKGDIEPEG